MKHRILSLLALTAGFMLFTTPAHAADYDEVTEGALLMTQDHVTVTASVTRDGTTTSLSNGENAKVGEALSLAITPNVGYYFSDYTATAKTYPLTVTRDMLTVVNYDDAANYYDATGTWTALSADDSYQNGLRTSGWKVALPYGNSDVKSIKVTMPATGVLSFDYATSIGHEKYGGYLINLFVDGEHVKQYKDYQSLQTENRDLVCSEQGISVQKGQVVRWSFTNANPEGKKLDDVYGYIGNVKVTVPEFDIRDYVSGLYSVVRGYPLQMNVDTATVSVTTTRGGETLTLSENSTVFLGETLTVNYTPTGEHRYADTTNGTKTFDVKLTDDYINTDAYTVDFNSADQFTTVLGDWTFNATMPDLIPYNVWVKDKTNSWTVEMPCSSTDAEATKRIKATMPFDGTLSYEYSFADFAVSSADCNYYRLRFYSSDEDFNDNLYTSYSDFYGVSNPSPRVVTNTAGVKNGATVYWELYYAGGDSYYTGNGYLGNVRLTSDGSIDLRRSYPTTYSTFLPLSFYAEGSIITASTTRDGQEVELRSGDIAHLGERIYYTNTSVPGFIDSNSLEVNKTQYFDVVSTMRDTTCVVDLREDSDLSIVSGEWTTLSQDNYYQDEAYSVGLKAKMASGDFTAKSLQTTVAADGVLTYIVAVNNAGKFDEYGTFDVALYVNDTLQKSYREFKDALASDAAADYSFVESGVEVKTGDVVRWDFTRLTDGSSTEAPEMYCYLGNVQLTTQKACYNACSEFPTLHKDFTLIVPTDTAGFCTAAVTVERNGETVTLTDGATFRRHETLTLTLTIDDLHCWNDDQEDQEPKTFTFDVNVDYVPAAIRDTINAYYGRAFCHHDYDNGICTRCSFHQIPKIYEDKWVMKWTYYYIANAGNLLYFSDYVNGKIDGTKHPDANASLASYIDLTGIDYTPIGDVANGIYYSGIFGDASHPYKTATIKLDLKGGENVGLIAVADGAKINCITIEGSVKGTKNVGAFVGRTRGDGASFFRCTNKATVTTDVQKDCEDCAGGFVGYHEKFAIAKKGMLDFTLCENYGEIKSYHHTGGFVGEAKDSVVFNNCANHARAYSNSYSGYFIGHIQNAASVMTSCYNSCDWLDAFVDCGENVKRTFTNCYNVNEFKINDGISVYTAEQAASGELCFKLNNENADFRNYSYNYWTQRLGQDNMPTMVKDSQNRERTVNKVTVTRLRCDEDSVDEAVYFNSDSISFNNDPTSFCILKSLDAVNSKVNDAISYHSGLKGYNTLFWESYWWKNWKCYYCENACLVDTVNYNIPHSYYASQFTYKRTLKSAGFSTFILPVSVDASIVNGKVYKLTDFTDGALIFERVEGTVEANTPYLVYTTEDSLSLLSTMPGEIFAQAMTPTDVTVTNGNTSITHRGTYVKERSSAADHPDATLYGYSGGQFWKLNGRYVLKPFRTMMEVTSTDAAVRPASLAISIDGEVSGIVTPDLESTTVDVYSLDGRLVRKAVPSATALRDLPRGVYIVGGKKVVKR